MKYFSKVLAFGGLGLLFLLMAGIINTFAPRQAKTVTVGSSVFNVEVADAPSEWQRGLVGHRELEHGEGMLFLFSQPTEQTFWMKGMSFPVDVIWIAGGEVIGFVDRAEPDDGSRLYRSPGNVDVVLEVAAGERDRLDLSVGDHVTVE